MQGRNLANSVFVSEIPSSCKHTRYNAGRDSSDQRRSWGGHKPDIFDAVPAVTAVEEYTNSNPPRAVDCHPRGRLEGVFFFWEIQKPVSFFYRKRKRVVGNRPPPEAVASMIFYLADTWPAQLPSLRCRQRHGSIQPSPGQHSCPACATNRNIPLPDRHPASTAGRPTLKICHWHIFLTLRRCGATALRCCGPFTIGGSGKYSDPPPLKCRRWCRCWSTATWRSGNKSWGCPHTLTARSRTPAAGSNRS